MLESVDNPLTLCYNITNEMLGAKNGIKTFTNEKRFNARVVGV